MLVKSVRFNKEDLNNKINLLHKEPAQDIFNLKLIYLEGYGEEDEYNN